MFWHAFKIFPRLLAVVISCQSRDRLDLTEHNYVASPAQLGGGLGDPLPEEHQVGTQKGEIRGSSEEICNVDELFCRTTAIGNPRRTPPPRPSTRSR